MSQKNWKTLDGDGAKFEQIVCGYLHMEPESAGGFAPKPGKGGDRGVDYISSDGSRVWQVKSFSTISSQSRQSQIKNSFHDAVDDNPLMKEWNLVLLTEVTFEQQAKIEEMARLKDPSIKINILGSTQLDVWASRYLDFTNMMFGDDNRITESLVRLSEAIKSTDPLNLLDNIYEQIDFLNKFSPLYRVAICIGAPADIGDNPFKDAPQSFTGLSVGGDSSRDVALHLNFFNKIPNLFSNATVYVQDPLKLLHGNPIEADITPSLPGFPSRFFETKKGEIKYGTHFREMVPPILIYPKGYKSTPISFRKIVETGRVKGEYQLFTEHDYITMVIQYSEKEGFKLEPGFNSELPFYSGHISELIALYFFLAEVEKGAELILEIEDSSIPYNTAGWGQNGDKSMLDLANFKKNIEVGFFLLLLGVGFGGPNTFEASPYSNYIPDDLAKEAFEILERIARSDIELMSKLREAAIQKRIEDSDQ